MGCPRRQGTPDLFHPTRIVRIRQISVETPHGPPRALCVITSVVTTAVMKGMLNNPNQYTDLSMIHLGIHTQSG
jgi:hypothetical protein